MLAKRLEEAGCATVMPLGAWIGSNLGVRTRDAIRIIVEQAEVPVVVDAGLGAPSHAAEAMEMGVDAVLVNTAIAVATRSLADGGARSSKAVEAGRDAYLAGLAPQRVEAEASSPLTGFLDPMAPSRRSRRFRDDAHRTSHVRRRARGDRRARHSPSVRSTATDADVTRALARAAGERDLDDLAALLSPAAGARLEEVARAAHRLTSAGSARRSTCTRRSTSRTSA